LKEENESLVKQKKETGEYQNKLIEENSNLKEQNKKLMVLNTVFSERWLAFEKGKSALEEKETNNEIKLQQENESLKNLNDCLHQQVISCENDAATLQAEIEDLKNSLSKFVKRKDNLNKLLGSNVNF